MKALVTGGSHGIGRAIAERLAADGAAVTLVARGREALAGTLAALPGDGHRACGLDVTDEAAWAALELQELDALVCAAGVLGPIGSPGSYEPAEFLSAVRVNLFGTMLAVHHCLPCLRRSRGAVVTLSGGGATGPLPRYDAYAASKAAVVRLTENLAAGLADDGVRINAVAPGFVATRMHEATLAAGPQAAGERYFERTRRDLEAGGVPPTLAADLVAFLLSPQADGISGKLLSAQWDPWREAGFRARLRDERDLATLRRIDDQFFAAVAS